MNGLTPDITAAEVVRHGVLRLTFADGLSGEVDVLDRMPGPMFEDARTPEGFAKVAVDKRPCKAEGVGFEPTSALRRQRFSRPPRSTTPAPLQGPGQANPSSGSVRTTRLANSPPRQGRSVRERTATLSDAMGSD
jgi:hypothetical protein